jgi:adenylate cyclase class 2
MISPTETEVKLRVDNASEASVRIQNAGFRLSKSREFEANTLYDTSDRRLFRDGVILRLRQAGDEGIVTWKGRTIAGPHKSRPELETTVGSLQTIHAILTELGYSPSFRYEKYRTEFRSDQSHGVIVLDETPIGTFLELEGESSWIDETAGILGYTAADYILDSYGSLYRKFCESRGLQPSHMVFTSDK